MSSITYQHIRNATARIDYADSVFLVDPFLAEKGAYPGFEGTPNSEKRIPLIDLPMPVQEVVRGIDAVILTHTHLDHWDESAQKILPKDIPFFVQNAGDARTIREQGFTSQMSWLPGKILPSRTYEYHAHQGSTARTLFILFLRWLNLPGTLWDSFCSLTG